MRYKLADVWRNDRTRDGFAAWWFETPWRSLRNFRTLLLEPGYGWLRWGFRVEQEPHGWTEPGETYCVAPPLRRLFDRLRSGEWVWPTDNYYRWPTDFIVGPPKRGVRW